MDALVAAAGPTPASLAEFTTEPYKCLLAVGGRRLIDICLEALWGAERVERVCVVGPPMLRERIELRPEDLWVDDQGSGPANIMAGLAALADRDQIVFCASDVPFLTAAGIDDLIARTPPEVGFGVPIYRREEVEAKLPEAGNKYVPFQEGDLTASSVMVIGPRQMAVQRERVDTLFNARKHFLRLFAMMGPGTAIKFVLAMKFGWRVLSVPALEAKISRLMGFPVKAVFGADPAFNFDIDHDRDYAECLKLLERLQ
jgi:hypothetical protein